jgi:hypothetical protein
MPGGKYWEAVNGKNPTHTLEDIKEIARQSLTPLVQIELFDTYEYQPAEYDDKGQPTQKEYIDFGVNTKPKYTNKLYWTQTKLKQHGFLTEASNLMWE